MSTRGAWGFRINGQDKVTYNHSDSYPEYLGNVIVTGISKTNLENLKEVANNIILVDQDSMPTNEQISEVIGYSNFNVGRGENHDWYCLLREARGNIGAYINHNLKYMIDNGDFLEDSLFCEYAYIINLDSGMFEFYKGFNENESAPGRYASLTENGSDYYGVALLIEHPLSEIFGIDSDEVKFLVKVMCSSAHPDEDDEE